MKQRVHTAHTNIRNEQELTAVRMCTQITDNLCISFSSSITVPCIASWPEVTVFIRNHSVHYPEQKKRKKYGKNHIIALNNNISIFMNSAKLQNYDHFLLAGCSSLIYSLRRFLLLLLFVLCGCGSGGNRIEESRPAKAASWRRYARFRISEFKDEIRRCYVLNVENCKPVCE